MIAPAPSLSSPSEGYVFVVAYGRSGSTLVQAMLNALPGVCVRGENANALRGLYDSWRRLADTPQIAGARAGAVSSASDTPWFGAEAIEVDAYARALGAAFTAHVLSPPAGTRIAGCKEIRFHEGPGGWKDVPGWDGPGGFRGLIDFLCLAFPGARFVFNTRDHAAVARSGWWVQVDRARMERMLGDLDDLYTAAADHLGARALRLCYDDYAGNPDGLAPLFRFMDRPFDADLARRVLDRRLGHSGV